MKLEIGHTNNFEVRSETIYSDKFNGVILFISDLHLNRFSGIKIDWIIDRVKEINPDLILLGGDYIDSKRGIIHFKKLLKNITNQAPIFAIPGNHDYYYGIEKIKKIIVDNSISWIENSEKTIQIRNQNIQISDKSNHSLTSESTFNVLLCHNPNEAKKCSEFVDLICSGHLHGSQVVWWKNKKGLYPGRFFYKFNILKTTINKATLFVSKGMGDTLPLRYNCKKEIILIHSKPKN